MVKLQNLKFLIYVYLFVNRFHIFDDTNDFKSKQKTRITLYYNYERITVPVCQYRYSFYEQCFAHYYIILYNTRLHHNNI